jgi:hypothetical protein
MSDEISVDRLTKTYVKIRDKRRELQAQDDALKEQLDAIAHKLLEVCKEQGLSTMRTDYGTVSRRVSRNYWTNDWGAFMDFVKENEAFSVLQHRINNSNMAQFLEENPDLHPPGLNMDAHQTVVITKR